MVTLEKILNTGKTISRSLSGMEDYEMPKLKEISIRLLGVFLASAIPNVGVGAAIDVSIWKAMLMSGGMAVLAVVQQLANAWRQDGKLSDDELDEIFHGDA